MQAASPILFRGRGGSSGSEDNLDHVTRVMGYHPKYLNIFLKTQNFLLRGDGPLPYDYRHYIAIMAAGRHQCSYLINLHKEAFIMIGGNKEWLKGLQYIPKKLRNLNEINKILAHRPWLIQQTHIQMLRKGDDCWSLSEVVHAIVLLTHYHALCSFVYSCGLNERLNREQQQCSSSSTKTSTGVPSDALDTRNMVYSSTCAGFPKNNGCITERCGGARGEGKFCGKCKKGNDAMLCQQHQAQCGGESCRCMQANTPATSQDENEVDLNDIMERMKKLPHVLDSYSEEEKTRRFQWHSTEVDTSKLKMRQLSKQLVLSKDIAQFVDDAEFRYDDNASKALVILRVQDYSWGDQGFPVVNRLYNEVGNLLDEKFNITYNLTYYTMGGNTHVDTTAFRRAIWNYVQCIFAIRHDDYNYEEISQLMGRTLKTFIKVACVIPERITKQDYYSVLSQLHYSEKIHINLMILEARMQAELLYALRSIMPLMT